MCRQSPSPASSASLASRPPGPELAGRLPAPLLEAFPMANPPEKPAESGRDYRSTLFLPATDFPMKAGLPEAEPKWLSRWGGMNLYACLRANAKGKELFI